MNFKKLKRCLSIALSASMILSTNMTGFAAEMTAEPAAITEESQEADAHEHDWQLVETLKGIERYECSGCEETKTVALKANTTEEDQTEADADEVDQTETDITDTTEAADSITESRSPSKAPASADDAIMTVDDGDNVTEPTDRRKHSAREKHPLEAIGRMLSYSV